MIHTIIIYIFTVISTIVFGSLAIAVSLFDRTGDNVHRVARMWAKSLLLVTCVKVRTRGLSNIDPGRSCIYMSNHQSNYDIPVLLGCLIVQFRWLAKAELFKIPLFGRSMRGAGYISIDRTNRKSAFRSLKRAAEIIRDGTSVLIFPEGTRSEYGKIKEFKKGGFVMAVDAGVPIVPVIIHGTLPIMQKHRLVIRPGQVSLDVLDPIETSGYTRKTKDDLIEKIRNILIHAHERLERGEPAC